MIKSVTFVGLTPVGEAVTKTSTSVEEVRMHGSEFEIAWSEFTVDDTSSEAEKVVDACSLPMKPSELLSGYLSNYEDLGEVLGLMMPIIRLNDSGIETRPLIAFVTRNGLYTILDESVGRVLQLSRYATTYFKKLPRGTDAWADRQTIVLLRIIDDLIEHNFSVLRAIVERAELLEIRIAEGSALPRSLTGDLSSIKKTISLFLNATWATHNTVHAMRYGDAEMITDREELLSKFDVIMGELDRQIEMAQHALEVLTAGINALQTEVSNKLTTLVLWLTVVGTAVLVPNTLATVFGAFPLPPEQGWVGLVSTVLSTAVATAGSYLYMRRWLRTG